VNIEKYINFKATALEIEEIIKNWIKDSKYDLIKFENYNSFEIKAKSSLYINIRELMDSITIIIKGEEIMVNEIGAYLNTRLPEASSFVVSEENSSSAGNDDEDKDELKKCLICEQLQPSNFKFCLHCGAILE